MTLITPQLALGDCDDPVKHGQHVDAFLCCASELPIPAKKPGHHLPLKDGLPIGQDLLEAAFRFLDEQLEAKRLVLIYCGHGTSRSASVLAGYLALKSGQDLEAVLGQVRRLRPAVSPSRGTWQAIAGYVDDQRSNPL